ncbi:MAG TPA: acyl carrier protein [Steroidobacteraceae bacterium]|nr:acyl carrier protein [Steroidobacteraceae bacterium]
MNRDQVFAELQAVFDQVFFEPVIVSPDLSASDVPEWTSLTHVALVLAIEERFKIRFRLGEIEATQRLGDLADLILRHLSPKS